MSLQAENYRNYSIVLRRQTTIKVRSFSLGSTPRDVRANLRGALIFHEENNVGKTFTWPLQAATSFYGAKRLPGRGELRTYLWGYWEVLPPRG